MIDKNKKKMPSRNVSLRGVDGAPSTLIKTLNQGKGHKKYVYLPKAGIF